MDEMLQKKIMNLIEITETLPDRYREKCFEILLQNYLSGISVPEKAPESTEDIKGDIQKKFVLPIGVRAFLQQYNIPEVNIDNIFLIDGGDIEPKYSIKTTKKADAQIQIALLTALENALRPNGKFEFDMEVVRVRCKDHGVYDQPNFKTHFKNNKKLFKDLIDQEHVELTPDGKAELAETISAIIK